MLSGFFTVLGGLALFLFGVEACRQSFQEGGGCLHRTLFKLARGRFMPFIFGTSLTLLSQSSTIATSLAIGFVDIGMIRLTEAILVMSGASLGGGLVILLISRNIVQAGPLLLFVSLLLVRLPRKAEVRNYGRILQGIALIFLGMLAIQAGVVPIVENPNISDLILWSSQNFLLIGFVAFLLTSLIQNNTAVVAIAISIAGTGLITPTAGMAIVLGAHIGSTTIILISGLGGKLNARRLGMATVVYKLLGTLVMACAVPFMPALFRRLGLSVSSSLVLFQVLLAFVNALAVTPFSSVLRRLCEFLFPAVRNPAEPAYLNAQLQNVPAVALALLSRELVRLSNFLEAYFQILFTHPSERRRLPKLQEDVWKLFRECRKYFSVIPIPQGAPALRRQHFNLAITLSSLEMMASGIHFELSRLWMPDLLEHGSIGSLMSSFLSLLRHSFRFFVLGDKEIARSARIHIENYRASENRLNYALLLDLDREYGENGRELMTILSVLGRAVYAAEQMLENLEHDESRLSPSRAME